MADELSIALMAEENVIQGSGVAECVIDLARTTVLYGTAHVDNPLSISQELAAAQASKAFTLRTLFGIPGSSLTKPSQGQVGFLRGKRCWYRRSRSRAHLPGKDAIPSSPGGQMQYAVTPVTAKHNLRRIKPVVQGIPKTFDAVSTETYLPWDPEVRVHLTFPNLNWIPAHTDRLILRGAESESDNPMIWPFGNDIAAGNKIRSYTQGVTSADGSYERVRPSFNYEVGQRIGIAVLSEHAPTSITASYNPENPSLYHEDTLKRVFGDPNNVNIYTGKILLVGDSHVEHDINTFTGCSGAIVFLLDIEQPSSVTPRDFGTAIAVHAGSHPTLRTRNLAFKISQLT
jgi:hypothetical protein